jgi:hypothetical protein
MEKACEDCESQTRKDIDQIVADAIALDPTLAEALKKFATKETGKLKQRERVAQNPSPAPDSAKVDPEWEPILRTGYALIDQRLAILRSETLKNSVDRATEELRELDQREVNARKAQDDALLANDVSKYDEAKNALAFIAAKRVSVGQRLTSATGEGSLAFINRSFDAHIAKAKSSFAGYLALIFKGREANKATGIIKIEPVAHVTPAILNYEFQKIVADGSKLIKELPNEAKIDFASEQIEMNAFNDALQSALDLRDSIVYYRFKELESAGEKLTDESREAFIQKHYAPAAQLLIDAQIPLKEFTRPGLAPSKCTQPDGCGSITDAREGTNLKESVKKTIELILGNPTSPSLRR